MLQQRDVKRELFESLSWWHLEAEDMLRQKQEEEKIQAWGSCLRHGVGLKHLPTLCVDRSSAFRLKKHEFLLWFHPYHIVFLGLPVTSLVIENLLINVNFSSIIQLSQPLSASSTQDYANRKEKMLQLRKQKEEEVFQSKQAKETQLA